MAAGAREPERLHGIVLELGSGATASAELGACFQGDRIAAGGSRVDASSHVPSYLSSDGFRLDLTRKARPAVVAIASLCSGPRAGGVSRSSFRAIDACSVRRVAFHALREE